MAKKFLTGIDLQSQRIQNVASASAATDAPNWAQVQALTFGLDWKQSCRAATTANISISSPGGTIDGVSMNAGDRFLAKNQSTASQNGIYVWNGASSAATRSTDAAQGTLSANATVAVSEGTANADTNWTLTTNDPITVDTTGQTWVQVNGSGTAYVGGNGISISGSTIAVDATVVTRKYAANVGDGSTTTYTVTHNLGTLDVQVQLYLVSTGETVEADVIRSSTNAIALTFATAPASNAYRVVVMG